MTKKTCGVKSWHKLKKSQCGIYWYCPRCEPEFRKINEGS
jgi:hypothetical protein